MNFARGDRRIYMEVKAYAGSDIEEVCESAFKLSKKIRTDVRFNFNGIGILVTSTDTPKKLVNEYQLRLKAQGEVI